MKRLTTLLPFLLLLGMSCNQKSEKSEAQKQAELDSFSKKTYGRSFKEQVQHQTDSVIKGALIDTVGLYKAPVKIISAKFVKKEYSEFKDIQLEYKNVSKKSIDGIKFRWYGETVFGDPADMGASVTKGFGGGFTDEQLKPNEKTESEWSILSSDVKIVVLACRI
jgi:hypothetical protein